LLTFGEARANSFSRHLVSFSLHRVGSGVGNFHSPCHQGRGSVLQRVAVMGSDDRMTFSEYAAAKGKTEAEIIQKYSAVGLFSCDGTWVQVS
jgi:hypothetical protein